MIGSAGTPPCFDRPDYERTIRVPNGWSLAGQRIYTTIPNRMSLGCQQHGPFGAATLYKWNCNGCRHLPDTARSERSEAS